MTIKEQINADFMEAYKAKNMEKKNFLGVLKGAIQTQEGKNIESTDENVLKVIKSLEKGINENIEGRKASGLDTAEQELELSYIKPYQPELMSEEEIRVNIHHVIINSGETNMGKIMGLFNKAYAGQAFDNKLVAQLIKEELA
jgi:uncharacterized protein YqeY